MVVEAYLWNEASEWEGWVVRRREADDTDVLLLHEYEMSWGFGDGVSEEFCGELHGSDV